MKGSGGVGVQKNRCGGKDRQPSQEVHGETSVVITTGWQLEQAGKHLKT